MVKHTFKILRCEHSLQIKFSTHKKYCVEAFKIDWKFILGYVAKRRKFWIYLQLGPRQLSFFVEESCENKKCNIAFSSP